MRTSPLAIAIVVGALARVAGAAEGVDVRYSEPLVDLTVAAPQAAGAAKPMAGSPTEVKFLALGREFDLALEPNARLEKATQQLHATGTVTALRGSIKGAPHSWVRLVLSPEGPAGLIFDGSTLYAIETRQDTAVRDAKSAAAIFRLADVYLAPGTLSCSAIEPAATASQALQAMVGEFQTLAAQGARLNLDIGAVADAEFAASFADPSAALLTRFNNVDGIFSEQVGVQISVADITVFSAADQPFTTTNPSDLLDELAEYRGATPAQDALGLTHLFTGRNLDGTTAGIAFVGSLCSKKSRFDPLGRSFGAGLSEGRRGAATDSLVAAHEIGHNFGAPHDAEAGSACESTPATFLMAPSINGSDQFSQCSLDQMQAEIASATCLQPIGAADVALAAVAPNFTALAGVAFDYGLTVTNVGVDPATNVGVELSADAGLTLQAAAPSSGTCSISGQTVSCALGDVAGGSARQVTITMRADTPGALAVSGTATADADADPTNDSLADTITVVPVVDLVLSGADSSASLNGQRTLTATLENAGDFTATSVALVATLTGGLRADAATLDGTACGITGQTVSCSASALPARATAALELTVTALAAGTQHASLTARAQEAERNTSDNDLTFAVSVAAPAANGSNKSGGGAASWLMLLVLAGAALIRRRRGATTSLPLGR